MDPEASAGNPDARGHPVEITIYRSNGREKKYNLREIADASGLSISTVSLILRGKRMGWPATNKRLADALKISTDDLISYVLDRRREYLAKRTARIGAIKMSRAKK